MDVGRHHAQAGGLVVEWTGWSDFPVHEQMLSAELTPMGEGRPAGLHLSAVIQRMRVAAGEKSGEIPGDQPMTRMQEGFLWETALEYMIGGLSLDDAIELAFKRHMIALRKNITTQTKVEKDGIHMTPDGLDREKGELESYKCVTPDTKILTHDLRWVEAGSVQSGDILLGFSEYPYLHRTKNQRDWTPTLVTNNEETQKECMRVVLANGAELTCSNDHLWLMIGKGGQYRWVKTSELIVGRKVKYLLDPWSDNNSWNAGYLSAAFDGEGSLVHNRYGRQSKQACLQLTFTQNLNPMWYKTTALLDKYEFFYSQYDVRDAKRVAIGRKYEAMRFLGIMRPPRLIMKFNPRYLGTIAPSQNIKVTQIEPVGRKTVMALETDAHTFVANGIAAHNCTRKSFAKAATLDDFSAHYWAWLVQEQSYAYALGVDTVRWIVLFQAGDYSKGRGTGPRVMQATAVFTADELTANWRMVLANAKGLGDEVPLDV